MAEDGKILLVNEITGEMLKHESASVLHWVHLICRLAWEVWQKILQGMGGHRHDIIYIYNI